jgi:superfamily II DNA or RNA helicase
VNSKELFVNINTWDDFTSTLENLNKKEKGDAFELLTKLYFKLSPKYSFYDEVWMLSEVPVSVIEELRIPSHDLGIDLIAKSGNEFHAIQCKYHSDKNQSVTFKEVSTFISLLESNAKFTQGYICSSADVTSRNYNKLNTKPINLVLSDSWQELEQEFFENVRNSLNKRKVSLVPFEPRDHQKKSLSEAVEYFVNEGNSRGKLIFPCGAGKSLTGFWMLQQLQSKSTLIAVPSLSLVKQTLDVYLREIVAHQRKVKWLCICSDEGIGQDDDVVFYTENLGVPCQTDPEYIEKWLRENQDEEIIVFTTYQSGRIIGEISKKLNYSFDLGIFDEAHKTVGSDKKLFSHLLFEENISIQKRIFMTATERFYRGSKDDIISMDDYDIYGDTFTQMSFKEAIELGLLTDYKVITIDVKKSEIADFIKQNNLVQLNNKWKKETEARSLASMLALRKAMKQFPIKNAVSFHSSIEKATRNKELQHHITDTYNYEPIDTYTVSGKLPTSKRNVIVQEFARSPKSLITNARCLTEGVDVPNIDCIVFSDPRKSKVDIVQALGRALRKKEGKDWGYVILPVIYDEETHEIDNENFQEILSIVRGLASNDERIVEYFKDKAEPGNANKTSERQFQLEVFSEFVDESELSNQLQIRLWEKLSRFSWMPFEEAKNYLKKFSFKSQVEFWEAHKKGIIQKNIPYYAHQHYKHSGFSTYPDFLGYTGLFREMLSFELARNEVHKWGLKNSTEWRLLCTQEKIPTNIPKRPDNFYRDKGWISFGDWLGTGRRKKGYENYENAKNYIIQLNIKTRSEWISRFENGEILKAIPKHPDQTYKNDGWTSWGDFLGSGRIADNLKEYKSFELAREFVRKFNLQNTNEWKELCRSKDFPKDIPKSPHIVYKAKGWQGMYDWIGRKEKARRYENRELLSFSDARLFARSLELLSWNEWRHFAKSGNLPLNIPKDPSKVYKKTGWINWGDWLGTGTVSSKDKPFLNFEEAKVVVKMLKLKSSSEWREWCKNGKRPYNIPANPNTVYTSDGWVSWGDFLGTGNISQKEKIFLDFEEARKFVRSLMLKNEREWRKWKRENSLPSNIPGNPDRIYKNKGWNGMSDWLRSNSNSDLKIIFRDFNNARSFVRKLGLKSVLQWRQYCKTGNKPNDIPSNPESVYKMNGWVNMEDWLGTQIIANRDKIFLEFEEARNIIRRLNLKNQKQWLEYCKSDKKQKNIPSNPQLTYKNSGWKDLGDWLGTHNKSNKKKDFLNFKDARIYVHKLKIQSVKEWTLFCKSGNFNLSLPTNPNIVYSSEWKGWADFLGKDEK